MWPFRKKPEKIPGQATRGRITLDTSGGEQRAKAKAEADVQIKVYRAKQDRWYTLDEIRERGEQKG